MRGFSPETSLLNPIPELIAEAVCRERFTEFRHKISKVANWSGIEDLAQFMKDWDRYFGSRLLLLEVQPTVVFVLPPETDDVAAALPRVQK